MQFRTQLALPKSSFQMDYNSEIISLGSCFAENIASKLKEYKFQIYSNPFGILFHPIAIENIFKRAIYQDFFREEDVFYYNERWQSFALHSECYHTDKEMFLDEINRKIKNFHQQLVKASTIIITFGTAWVYKEINSQKIVANCHKVPQKEFEKELLSKERIEESIANTIALVHKINPNCNFIFTISPVRHIKDGFVENQLSKSLLISALHTTISKDKNCFYFPSYEIMMDDLRDYRFYAEDMLHPNAVAIDYIWNAFVATNFSEETQNIMRQVLEIQKAMQHRPFHQNSEQHLLFLEKLNQKKTNLAEKYPQIQF